MLKHQFVCSDKEFTRCKFEDLMTYDTPCGKSIFGQNLYSSGIHFTECSEKIRGFYISSSENESTKGSPIKVSFNGVFLQKEDKTFFEVIIYPNLLQLLFLVIAFLFLIFTTKAFGVIMVSLVFSVFIIGYYSNIKKAVAEFQKIIH